MLPAPLQNLFNSTATVERLADIAASVNENYAAHLTGVRGLMVPLEESFSTDLQGSFGKDFYFYCDTVDIKEGDRMTIATELYRVTGVQAFSQFGNDVLTVRIRKFND